jgi:hypothetical protein
MTQQEQIVRLKQMHEEQDQKNRKRWIKAYDSQMGKPGTCPTSLNRAHCLGLTTYHCMICASPHVVPSGPCAYQAAVFYCKLQDLLTHKKAEIKAGLAAKKPAT